MAQAHRNIANIKKKQDIEKGEGEKLHIILLNAGIPHGMKTRGPKCLFEIKDGETILERQINLFRKAYPNSEIIVVTGFEHNKIRKAVWEKYDIRLVYNDRYETRNTLYSAKLGLYTCRPGPVLIAHGDLIFNERAIIGLAGESSSILIHANMNKDEIGVSNSDNYVSIMSYGSPLKWGQMIYMRDKELKIFTKLIINNEETNRWLLYEAISKSIEKGAMFNIYQPNNAVVMDVDKLDDLIKAKEII